MLKSATKKLAEYLALNPTATMMHAPNPTIETRIRATDQLPWKMKPIKRKMSRIRPASWKLPHQPSSISTAPRRDIKWL